MNRNHHSLKHYKEHHYEAIDNANSYEELTRVALDVLKNMPQPVGEVCGPASTGGTGSIAKNLEIIEKTTHKLADEGHSIFNWVPFEQKFKILKERNGTHTREKNEMLLDGFYSVIFNSGLIKKAFFIHGWESSHGATWERNICQKNKIEIIDLPKEFLEKS